MTNTRLPVPATTRPIKLHEVVLIVLNRRPAEGDTGVSAETLTLLLMTEPLAGNVNCNLNSIYASMSGMQTPGRKWIEQSSPPKRGRGAPYRITDDGRARARFLLAELESKELNDGA